MERINHINHAKLAFSCGAGAANINVFTGRALFESPDISVGVNSYEMSVTHVYDSQCNRNIETNMGNGWKLNIQQYITQSYKDSQTIYLYTDAYGYVHEFEKFDGDTNLEKYFDRSGLGLVLWVKEDECFIEDGQGGKMYFKDFGYVKKLYKIVSGLNSTLLQVINYDSDGKISSMEDNSNPHHRKFEFEYYETSNLLLRIKCSDNNSSVEYSYDRYNNLVSVKKTVNYTIRYSVSYSYKNNLLKYAVNLEDNTSLKFVYDDSGRVTSVTDGIMKTEFNFSEPMPALFSSSSLFSGTNKYCGQQERKLIGLSVSDDSDIQPGDNYSGISFGSSQTTVRNGRGIKTTYFFNEKGFTIGILEKAKNGSYKTLFKQTGVDVSIDDGRGETINGNKAVSFEDRYTFTSEKRSKAKDFFNKKINKKSYDYLLTFWAKFEDRQAADIKAKLCLEYKTFKIHFNQYGDITKQDITNEELIVGSSMVDRTARGGWQYVTIPFSTQELTSRTNNGKYPYVKTVNTFKEICHIEFEGAVGKINVADVHITSGQIPVLKIKSGDLSVDLDKVTRIKYTKNGSEKSNPIGIDFFMTESDVAMTAFEMCKSAARGDSSYTLICNGGTKKVAKVSSLKFETDEGSVPLGYDAGEKDGAYTVYTPRCESVTQASTGDNKNVVTTSYTFNKLGQDRVMNYSRQKTYAQQNPDGALINATSEEYTWQDRFGRTTKKQDAYGVITECTYDGYGNLTQTKVRAKDNSKINPIITNYSYDSVKETLTSTKDGVSGDYHSADFKTDPLHGTLISTSQCASGGLSANTTEYTYNSFKDKLNWVQLKVGTDICGQNTLTYDQNGRLTAISPKDNINYGFNYDAFGRAISFSLNGVTLLTKEYDSKNNWVEASYYRSDSEIDRIKNKYDEYGRLKNVVGKTGENERQLSMTYQDEADGFEESPSCANIITMQDGFDGKSYSYEYDEFTGRPVSYTVINNDNSELFKVYPTGPNKIKYDFPWFRYDYTEETVYDKEKRLSPRVKEFKTGSGVNFTFSYDDLGRYTGRTATGHPDSTIAYKDGTLLKETITYSGGYSATINQEYDNRGNIKSITIGGKKNEYVYNSINQLEKEINAERSFTKSYSYDKMGNVTLVDDETVNKSYDYIYDDKARLVSVKENNNVIESYSYDSFGNPTSFKGKTMTWERGTLLKSYGNISYTYDGQCKISSKSVGNETEELIYDGDKLITKIKGGKRLQFFYDIEGIAGFKLIINGNSNTYTYIKDGQNNVIGLYGSNGYKAKYYYDAWGSCKIVNSSNNEITDPDSVAYLNPIRWKSQYYDSDSKLYYIGQRWYDSERCRYISSASPEMLLQNASVIFAVNLYSFCVSNPVAVLIAMSTYQASLDFYYNGEYESWWDAWGKWVFFGIVGVAATVLACVFSGPCGAAATAATVLSTLGKIAAATLVSAAIGLAIGGTIAGIMSAVTGHGFWQGFEDHVSENWVETLVTSFAFAAVTVAAGNFIKHGQCFKEGTLVETEEGLKPIEEIEVGDKVLAYDEETGEQAYKPVVRLFRNETNEWYHIHVNGEEIVCTGGHPFYLASLDKFIPAKELKLGDTLLLSNNTCVIIEEIQIEKLSTPEITYNFEVEDYHTYYVTESKVLVHNMCAIDDTVPENPLDDIQYTDKVKYQMSRGEDLYHSFPKMVDNFGGYGVQTSIVGNDGVTRTLLRIPGSINGNAGFFEYIYDASKICNHRLFVAL